MYSNGKIKLHEEPSENDSAEVVRRISREIMKHKKLNSILHGRLLTVVANRSPGYESPAVSTVLSHVPVHPETDHGYVAFQPLKTK